eukprot:4118725-Heterocapsa_arctica.AAC.1
MPRTCWSQCTPSLHHLRHHGTTGTSTTTHQWRTLRRDEAQSTTIHDARGDSSSLHRLGTRPST